LCPYKTPSGLLLSKMKATFKKKSTRGLFLYRLSRIKFLVGFTGGIALACAIFIFIQIFLPLKSAAADPTPFVLEEGHGVFQVASRLKAQGLIRSRFMFSLYTIATGKYGRLQTGNYLLTPALSTHEIANKFAKGDIVKETITIKEGWSLRNIAEEFENRGFFTQEEFFTVTGRPGVDYRDETASSRPQDFSEEFDFLAGKPHYVSLEGYLFPDTYEVTAQETPESIVRRMLRNFENNIDPVLPDIEAQGKTLFEAITMSSIIEKEVRSLEDKKLVSGILWKRLENGMRLEVDSTIVYVREGNYYRVTFEELKVKSSYNTYTNYGLPPGPISNPGIESIKAALHPAKSPYWFYLSPNINTTVFSETFDQHRAAANQYIR